MTNPGTGRSPYAARKHDHHNPLAGGRVVPSKALAAAGEPSATTVLYGDDRWGEIPTATPSPSAADDVDSPIEKVNTVAASGSVLTLPDVFDATMHDVTLTANCAITFPAASKGKSFSLELTQDGTGSRTVTWPASVTHDSGTAPTLSTAAGASDDFSVVCFKTGIWRVFFAGKGMA